LKYLRKSAKKMRQIPRRPLQSPIESVKKVPFKDYKEEWNVTEDF
jgi:hypothetical protein